MVSIGIDLGTTYSCVIHHQPDGTDKLISSADGGELTPSVVYFDPDGSVLVGESAKSLLRTDPENAVVGIKRHMGEDHPLEHHGNYFTPEAISAVILKRLAYDAADYFGVEPSELQAVITVPAYFGVAEKEATHAAARIAGLDCLELLAEPVAAAYAYGIGPNANECSLVFDLGGGTFDVAVVGMNRREPRIWAVDGETQLGGLDWDQRLNDLIWQRLIALGIDEDAIFEEDFAAALLTESELLKRKLSTHDSGTSRLRFKGKSYNAKITRTDFEAASADLVAQCIRATRRVIATASELGARPVARVLLVGGSTRIPAIRTALEREFGLPVLSHDPDSAVARGAAILASKLDHPDTFSQARHRVRRAPGRAHRPDSVHNVQRIAPVLPKAIGIKTYSSALPPRTEPYVMCVLPANTPLPVSAHQVTVATILQDQTTARIELFEQAGAEVSERIEDNRLLFDGEITNLPPRPAGSQIRIQISVGLDGRISVAARDDAGGALDLVAFIHGVIDEDELQEQMAKVSQLMMVR